MGPPVYSDPSSIGMFLGGRAGTGHAARKHAFDPLSRHGVGADPAAVLRAELERAPEAGQQAAAHASRRQRAAAASSARRARALAPCAPAIASR